MSELGKWVARYKGELRVTKFHYVETEIANREYSRCGRQFRPRAGTEIRASSAVTPSDDLCEQCA